MNNYFLTLLIVFYCNCIMSQDLTNKDIALIEEFVNLNTSLGTKVWRDWKMTEVPLLYKKNDFEFLMNHSDPPIGFHKYYSKALKKDVWKRKNVDTLNYQASYVINGINTVVMSEPSNDYPPCLWTLKAVHESFHIYQSLILIKNPFQENYSDYNEINFPFKYHDTIVKSWGQIESIYISAMVRKVNLTASDTLDVKRFFKQAEILSKEVYKDSLQFNYKQLLEWSEGVARYTEREIASLAAKETYSPTEKFQELFNNDYDEIWKKYYGEDRIFNPVRFVYQGVKGRVVFYYIGLAKSYLLDRINPNWKSKYLKYDLDQLLKD